MSSNTRGGMTTSLPMPAPVTAPLSRSRILATVTESPGMGAYQLADVLGCDGRRVDWTLQRMREAGLVVAHELPRRRVGQPARVWFAAPDGTPPQPRRESRAKVEDRRRRDRIAQQRRRARLAGKTITPEPRARPRVYLPPPPPAWQMPGDPACTGADPGLFFGPEIEAPQARVQRVTAAKAVCAGCPVRAACLDGALTRGERWGVWGGADLETERIHRSPKATRPAVADRV